METLSGSKVGVSEWLEEVAKTQSQRDTYSTSQEKRKVRLQSLAVDPRSTPHQPLRVVPPPPGGAFCIICPSFTEGVKVAAQDSLPILRCVVRCRFIGSRLAESFFTSCELKPYESHIVSRATVVLVIARILRGWLENRGRGPQRGGAHSAHAGVVSAGRAGG